MNIQSFSSIYKVRKLHIEDIDMLYEFCNNNPLFYLYNGKENTKEFIKQDLFVTPPGIPFEQKYYVGFFDGDKLIAIMDLIDGYPNRDTIFIGFFMMNAEEQGKGIGTLIIQEVLAYVKSLGYPYCQLGIDENNPQSNHFWKKQGFKVFNQVKQSYGNILLAIKHL